MPSLRMPFLLDQDLKGFKGHSKISASVIHNQALCP